MAREASYKQYNRQERRAVLDSNFSQGMMSTDGAVTEGYLKSLVNCTFEKETSTIVPRPSLRVHGTIVPNSATLIEGHFKDDNLIIKASKQCVEDGVTYEQVIICQEDDDNDSKGLIWVLTCDAFIENAELKFNEDYSGTVMFSDYVAVGGDQVCYFYATDSPSIHDVWFDEDQYKRIGFPVGEFAYGNSYYFFGEDENGNAKLFRTVFDKELAPPRYVFEQVEPKDISVSEAVTYGYNMLACAGAYEFINKYTANQMEFEGILPYNRDTGELLMTPKKNQAIDFVCYYNVPLNSRFDIAWEWRETSASDWTGISQENNKLFDGTEELRLENFKAPAKDIMVRIIAYEPGTQDVNKAMVVGFDFTASNYGTARSLEQKVYDLSTATGMESWNNRTALWGLPEDPTILFLSDYEEPAYFPYPNNIVTFKDPIVYCIEFMDSLAVFTTTALYQVKLSNDGNTWNTTLLQSHLNITPWDKHLIQPVRNMLYFKSGNYYYMMVPKAQSTTGELTIAPITTPITSFFDRFSVNVQNIIRDTYDYEGVLSLLTYYNFLDYEDIHNIYAYKFDETQSIVHFDVIYNTVDRTWKVWVFEAPTFVFPYRNDATKSGLLATTSLVPFEDVSQGYMRGIQRIIQTFCWDKMLVRSCYLNDQISLLYNPDNATVQLDDYCLVGDPRILTMYDNVLQINSDKFAEYDEEVLVIHDASDFYMGYSKKNILSNVKSSYDQQDVYYTFRNYQFIDTGYRDYNIHAKKRYREIQMLLNNLDKKNMQFGMEYILDGAPRKIFYKYEVSQAIDEMDPDYGIIYIDSVPYLEADLSDIDLTNQWTLDQGLNPDVSLWKIRIAVSGKGYAPRFRLFSRNEKRFELISLNWISKIMHMR